MNQGFVRTRTLNQQSDKELKALYETFLSYYSSLQHGGDDLVNKKLALLQCIDTLHSLINSYELQYQTCNRDIGMFENLSIDSENSLQNIQRDIDHARLRVENEQEEVKLRLIEQELLSSVLKLPKKSDILKDIANIENELLDLQQEQEQLQNERLQQIESINALLNMMKSLQPSVVDEFETNTQELPSTNSNNNTEPVLIENTSMSDE